MVAILENGEFNSDFHPMVDFIAASPLRYALTVKPAIFVSHIRQFWSTARIETTDEGTHILATVDGIQRTVSESSLRRNLKLRDEDGIVSIPDTELFENLTLMGARIAQSSVLPTVADEPASPVRDVSEGEACHTESGFIADQDRATIAKSSTLPHDSAPMVTSPAADKGSMQHNIFELTALYTSLQRQYSKLLVKFQAQEVEIVRLKERVQVLEGREGDAAKQSGDNASIKGRSINEGEAATERISSDSEEVARVLTSMDAATVLAGGIDVPTSSGFIPTAGPPATVISTGSEVGPTASPIVTRRKGKEVMVESDTPKKKKLQEQIDAQVENFIPMGSKEETEKLKRKGLNLEKEQEKKQKLSEEAPEIETSTEEFTKEKMKEMMQLVPIEDVYVQALQVKHPIIDWKVHTEGQRSYWQIISLGGSSACYQFFIDLLKQLDREDLNQLWALVKEYLSIRPASKWKLYDLSGVHHLTAKDKEIFMLVEKDYPLRKGLALVMISYKLQVENYSQMAEDLIRKIYNIANTPR
uniref:Xylulose kinase-1 n=1 Tax=Tanacetum cinerariifolium TaxID=118510 RepID=A0A699JG62_TANCI|nr:hypothetical protein [Tanacetum cinerariifolium]